MTAILRPTEHEASARRALRILPIAANLLPVEIVEARRVRKVRRIVLSALAVFAVLLAAWYAKASYETSTARSDLRNVEDDAQRLLRQQQAFAEVVGTQAESQAIRTQLSSLLTTDLRWSRLLWCLRKAALGGVRVTDVFGSLGSSPSASAGAGGSSASQLPSPSGKKPVGTLTVTGSGPSQEAIAAYIDTLAIVEGLGNPLLGDVTTQNGVLQFTVKLDVTSAALGGRYTPQSSGGPGKR
jgi:hypothetical protein